MPTRGKETYSIQSVDNALDVLEALCDEGDEVRISRLSERLGMNKTSVFRLLATFENRGYVEKEKGSGKYRLGLSAYEMGQKFLSRNTLMRKARPVMERLVRECGEAAYLSVRRDTDILFLDLVDSPQQVKIVSLAGRRFPLIQNSAGKTFYAYGSSPDPSDGTEPLERPPLQELLAIQKKGYALGRSEFGEGVSSITVPLLGATGEIHGCLSLIGPEFRLTERKIESIYLPITRDAGETISSKLGFLGKYLPGETS